MNDEMDILREVATTASAHGSSALSEMLKRKVILRVPEVSEVRMDALNEDARSDEFVVSVQSRILNGLEGQIIFALDERTAFRFINLCCPGENSTVSGFRTEMGFSVLKEIGNIVMGAYVGALSMFLKIVVIPAIPTLISGALGEIIKTSILTLGDTRIFLLDTVFEVAEEEVRGKIYFILTQEARGKIQEAGKKILESLSKDEKK